MSFALPSYPNVSSPMMGANGLSLPTIETCTWTKGADGKWICIPFLTAHKSKRQTLHGHTNPEIQNSPWGQSLGSTSNQPMMSGTIMSHFQGPGDQIQLMAPTVGLAESKGLGIMPVIGGIGSLVTSVLGVYHGYRRNGSVGWALGWFFFGALAWPVALPLMFAMKPGFAKPKPGVSINGSRFKRSTSKRHKAWAKASSKRRGR